MTFARRERGRGMNTSPFNARVVGWETANDDRLCGGYIHGALDRFYDGVLAFEEALGATFNRVLHVGDFGVWPEPNRVDGATRRHDGAGDFARWHAEKRAVPRPTVFVKGNHEDFVWLDAHPTGEVLPGLHYLRNGRVQILGAGEEAISVGGLGGCHGPSDYGRPGSSLEGYRKRHYTADEIESLASGAGIDILLLHDAPAGVRIPRGRDGEIVSTSAGLDVLVARTRPRLCFFGHHHTRVQAEVAGVRCVGLNKVAMPGHLVAVEIRSGEAGWRFLAEWPAQTQRVG